MSRNLLLSVYAVLFAMLGVGCEIGFGPGVLDWSCDLPDGSYIWRASSHTIEIHGHIEIPAKVIELDCDQRFVIAKQQHLTERAPGDEYMIPVDGKFSWWIGDLGSGKTHGPFDEQEFEMQRNSLGVSPDLVLHDVYDYCPLDRSHSANKPMNVRTGNSWMTSGGRSRLCNRCVLGSYVTEAGGQ